MQTAPLRRTLLHSVFFLCIASAPAAMANLVVNGGFETGDFTGWTLVDPSGLSIVGTNPAFSHSGNDHADLGTNFVPPGPPSTASLSQILGTTAGATYNLSFWLANDVTPPGSPFNSFEVFWNGGMVLALPTSSPAFDYTQFTISNLAATGPSTLAFLYENDSDFWRLDDVTVNASGVPDSGSTLWLALPGLMGLVIFQRASRRRRASLA